MSRTATTQAIAACIHRCAAADDGRTNRGARTRLAHQLMAQGCSSQVAAATAVAADAVGQAIAAAAQRCRQALNGGHHVQ